MAPPSAVPPRPPSSVVKPPAAAASAAPVAPVEAPKPAPRFITPQSVARPPATITIPTKPAKVASAASAKPSAAVVEHPVEEQAPATVDAVPEVDSAGC